MFYNLSLQVNSIEKQLSINQQEQLQQDLNNLQQSFINLTQQLTHINKQRKHDFIANLGRNEKPNVKHNVSGDYYQNLAGIQNSIEIFSERLRFLENNLIDAKATHQTNYILTNNQLSRLNDTVTKTRKMVTDHNERASQVFQDVKEKLVDYNVKIQHNTDRLTSVEVKVMNVSLVNCEKSNTDLTQDNFLNKLDKGMYIVEKRMDDMEVTMTK